MSREGSGQTAAGVTKQTRHPRQMAGSATGVEGERRGKNSVKGAQRGIHRIMCFVTQPMSQEAVANNGGKSVVTWQTSRTTALGTGEAVRNATSGSGSG